MKKTILAAALLTALLLVFTGCSNSGPNASASPSASASVSTEVADPSASPAESSVTVTVKGADYVSSLVTALGTTYMGSNPGVTIDTTPASTNTSIASVADGNADIALSSRPLKTEEKAVFPALKENLICVDGLAVVVSKDCSVSSLSAQQIKDIYLGVITNWKEVGGEDKNITVYTMGATTDISKRFNEQFLGGDEPGALNDAFYASPLSDNATIDATVGGDTAAIGYLPLSAITSDSSVKAVTIDAVLANAGNVKGGRYIYVLNYYLITNNPSNAVQAFVDYCKGAEAQAAITAKGLNVK